MDSYLSNIACVALSSMYECLLLWHVSLIHCLLFLLFYISFIELSKTQKNLASVPARFLKRFNYLVIVATTPAPTVRPPSRIENLVPSSSAIGAIRATVISMLSPGITISTPSGKLQIPVTSVVRK